MQVGLNLQVRFVILTVMNMKVVAFWKFQLNMLPASSAYNKIKL
jgi:hypothetical protein